MQCARGVKEGLLMSLSGHQWYTDKWLLVVLVINIYYTGKLRFFKIKVEKKIWNYSFFKKKKARKNQVRVSHSFCMWGDYIHKFLSEIIFDEL